MNDYVAYTLISLEVVGLVLALLLIGWTTISWVITERWQMRWYPNPNQLAQVGHFFIATTIVLAVRVLGWEWWVGGLVVLGWTLPKEFIFDLIVEQDSVSNSIEDTFWYVIGGCVAELFVVVVMLSGKE